MVKMDTDLPFDYSGDGTCGTFKLEEDAKDENLNNDR